MDSPVEGRRHGECLGSSCESSAKRMIRRKRTGRRSRLQVPSDCAIGFVCRFLLITMVRSLHQNTHNIFGSRRVGRGASASTRLRMVLRTPESIIEQASTTTLLDHLIDESVRTSARRPIMMQFDPSSGWIWKRWKGTIFSETWDACVSFRLIRRFSRFSPGEQT